MGFELKQSGKGKHVKIQPPVQIQNFFVSLSLSSLFPFHILMNVHSYRMTYIMSHFSCVINQEKSLVGRGKCPHRNLIHMFYYMPKHGHHFSLMACWMMVQIYS